MKVGNSYPELSDLFLNASRELGLNVVDDYNGREQGEETQNLVPLAGPERLIVLEFDQGRARRSSFPR